MRKLKSTFYEDKEMQDFFYRILSNKKKSYYLTESYNFVKEQFHFHLFELEHLFEHLIGILFGGNTMT